MTGDNHTRTIDINATLYGPPWHGQAPSRNQLWLMLQALLECICLNSTKDAVHQARQAVGHCLTEAQLLAYPTDQTTDQTLAGEERKRKLSKITGTPVTALESQNSAPTLAIKIEQPAKTAASDTSCDHAEPLQAITPDVACNGT